MKLQVGDKIHLMIDDYNSLSFNSKNKFESVVLCIEPDNSSYMLTMPDESGFSKITEDDVEYYSNTNNYISIPDLKKYLGIRRCWLTKDQVYHHLFDANQFKSSSVSGMKCADKYCNTYNEFATPNMPDGTYKCFSCRNRV